MYVCSRYVKNVNIRESSTKNISLSPSVQARQRGAFGVRERSLPFLCYSHKIVTSGSSYFLLPQTNRPWILYDSPLFFIYFPLLPLPVSNYYFGFTAVCLNSSVQVQIVFYFMSIFFIYFYFYLLSLKVPVFFN